MQHEQVGSIDCGCFALAYAVDIANGIDPTGVKYDQELMREHMAKALFTVEEEEHRFIKPFPRLPPPNPTATLPVILSDFSTTLANSPVLAENEQSETDVFPFHEEITLP